MCLALRLPSIKIRNLGWLLLPSRPDLGWQLYGSPTWHHAGRPTGGRNWNDWTHVPTNNTGRLNPAPTISPAMKCFSNWKPKYKIMDSLFHSFWNNFIDDWYTINCTYSKHATGWVLTGSFHVIFKNSFIRHNWCPTDLQCVTGWVVTHANPCESTTMTKRVNTSITLRSLCGTFVISPATHPQAATDHPLKISLDFLEFKKK